MEVDTQQGHHPGEADDEASQSPATHGLGPDQPKREHSGEQRVSGGEDPCHRGTDTVLAPRGEKRWQGDVQQGHPYYRCRFSNEYALANRVRRPLNVTLRQDAVLDPLDTWLAHKFAPHHLPATIEELAEAARIETPRDGYGEIAAKLAQCDRKLTQYRAALDAGGDPAVVARWIAETQAERAKYQALKRPASPRPSMSREEITTIVNTFADLLEVVRKADPADKAEIYARLGLRLTYQPGTRTVRAEARLDGSPHWHFESVRGGTHARWANNSPAPTPRRLIITWTTTLKTRNRT